MKALLIILISIMSLQMYGQQSDYSIGYQGDLTEFYEYQDSILNTWFKSMLSTVIIEYEVDCYNDSTVHYYELMRSGPRGDVYKKSCNKGDTTMFDRICPEHWHHKEATFKGFRKWLKDKDK